MTNQEILKLTGLTAAWTAFIVGMIFNYLWTFDHNRTVAAAMVRIHAAEAKAVHIMLPPPANV